MGSGHENRQSPDGQSTQHHAPRGPGQFLQEERAEHAAERLRDLLPRRVMVVRDGDRIEIPASEVVTGDTVVLGEGDRVSADLRLDVVHSLALDTSTLTGESVPAHPAAAETAS